MCRVFVVFFFFNKFEYTFECFLYQTGTLDNSGYFAKEVTDLVLAGLVGITAGS